MLDPKQKAFRINLTPKLTLCARHGEVFRATWPAGYNEYIHRAFKAFIRKQENIDAANGLLDTATMELRERRGITTIGRAIEYMLEKRPLCCHLERNELYAILVEVNRAVGVWPVHCCALCGRVGPGARYRKVPENGALVQLGEYDHVCLACVCGFQTQ